MIYNCVRFSRLVDRLLCIWPKIYFNRVYSYYFRLVRTENEIFSKQLRRRIQSQKKHIINALFPANILPVTSRNVITKEVTDTSNNINTDNSFQDRSTFPFYYSDDQVIRTSIFPPHNFNTKEVTLKELIASWAVKESINQKQLRGLLSILKTQSCHNDLLSDPRALCSEL